MADTVVPINTYERLQTEIAEKLCREGVGSGDRLPSERNLAEEFNVSYLTMRRSISEMVDRGILERRPRRGTYLKASGHRRLNNQSLMLVVLGFESELARRFVSLGIEEAAKRGWEPHVVQMDRTQDRVLIQALNSGESALILAAPDALTPEIVKALQDAKGRAVLVGNRLDAMGISSIVADDAQGVRLAMAYLQSCGHEHVAVLSSDPVYKIDQIQIATWKSCMSKVTFNQDDYVITVELPRFLSPLDDVYTKMRKWLENRPPKVTAVLCLIDALLPAVIRAVFDHGLNVPEDISLVGFGNTVVACYSNPAVTSVEPHLLEHVKKGIALIEDALSTDQGATEYGHLIQIDPELVVRQSVSSAFSQVV